MARCGKGGRAGKLPGWGVALGLGSLPGLALAQVPITMNGVPEQVIPQVLDVGLGAFAIIPGTGVPSTPGGGETGGGGGTATEAGSSTALDLMSSRSWGEAASAAATSVGVNPSALAATCLMESSCQNVSASSGSSIRGAFQMLDSTFEDGLTKAVSYNASLEGTVARGVDGSMDPANQAVSAAAVLRSTAEALQAAGISNPTVLDVRGGYNFGSAYTVALAQASNDQLMNSVLTSYTASQLSSNGISSTTTVGEWRTSVASKIGDAAYQSVLLSN